MPITRQDVIWAYSHFLGRRPENEQMIERWLVNANNKNQLAELVTSSREYKDLIALEQLSLSKLNLYNRTRHGFWFPAPTDRPGLLRAYSLHDYETEECDAIARIVKAGDTCIDLGSRHGYMTCLMAKIVGHNGVVYAFEPGDGSDVLEDACTINEFDNIKLIRAAAGDRKGEIRFSLSTARFDEAEGSISVPVVRLDDLEHELRKPVKFMKIDIEGAEYRAMMGARRFITRDRPTILIELFDECQREVSGKSVAELIGLFESWGYRLNNLAGMPLSHKEMTKLVEDNVVFNTLLLPA